MCFPRVGPDLLFSNSSVRPEGHPFRVLQGPSTSSRINLYILRGGNILKVVSIGLLMISPIFFSMTCFRYADMGVVHILGCLQGKLNEEYILREVIWKKN